MGLYCKTINKTYIEKWAGHKSYIRVIFEEKVIFMLLMVDRALFE